MIFLFYVRYSPPRPAPRSPPWRTSRSRMRGVGVWRLLGVSRGVCGDASGAPPRARRRAKNTARSRRRARRGRRRQGIDVHAHERDVGEGGGEVEEPRMESHARGAPRGGDVHAREGGDGERVAERGGVDGRGRRAVEPIFANSPRAYADRAPCARRTRKRRTRMPNRRRRTGVRGAVTTPTRAPPTKARGWARPPPCPARRKLRCRRVWKSLKLLIGSLARRPR